MSSSLKREHGQEFLDVVRGGYNTFPSRSSTAGLQGFVVRTYFLNEMGLQNMLLGRKVGPETANLNGQR